MADIDVITGKIIADAEKYRQSQIEDASKRVQTLINDAEKAGKAKLQKSIKDSEAEKAAMISRAETVAKLEAGKLMLSAKQQLIARSFELARERILSLPAEDYKLFLAKLLKKYAEDGDIAVLSKQDKLRFSEDDIKAMSGGKAIKLSKDSGDFTGGLILLSKNFDKNLTLSALFSLLRERIEDKVAKILFDTPAGES